jgi:hypothetical protein
MGMRPGAVVDEVNGQLPLHYLIMRQSRAHSQSGYSLFSPSKLLSLQVNQVNMTRRQGSGSRMVRCLVGRWQDGVGSVFRGRANRESGEKIDGYTPGIDGNAGSSSTVVHGRVQREGTSPRRGEILRGFTLRQPHAVLLAEGNHIAGLGSKRVGILTAPGIQVFAVEGFRPQTEHPHIHGASGDHGSTLHG